MKNGSLDVDTYDVDSMPDCKEKYHLIKARAKKHGKKFTDNQFKAGTSIIGDDILERGLRNIEPEWHRMSERDGVVIFRDGASFNDIT